MSKVIATDLDGTLFYPKHKIRMISPHYLYFLRKHIDSGGKVIIVSGRNFDSALRVQEKINRPIDFICCNSAYVKSDGEVIREIGITPKIIEILDILKERFKIVSSVLMSAEYSLVINTGKLHGIMRVLLKMYYFLQGVYAEKYVIDNGSLIRDELAKGHAYKLMLFFGLGRKGQDNARFAQAFLKENYPDIEAAFTSSFIEITPKACHKADGLKLICEKRKINKDDIFVVGDSGNDISMFDAFHDHSFCMSHAPEHVRCHAKYVIRKFNHLEKYLG